MRRLLILFEPVKVLDVLPKVRLACPLLLFLMNLSLLVVKGIGTEDDSIAVLYDGLACNVNVESAIVGVMNSQLMAVQLESTVFTVVHKDC